MKKKLVFIFVIALIIFIVDQYIKNIFVNGYTWHSECISLILAYNKGVAFSMFSFLDEYLKYIQIALMIFLVIFILKDKELFHNYTLSISLVFGGGISNIYDRFIHTQGVVDYIYWHCGFDFAIFNLADILINLAVAIGITKYFLLKRTTTKDK